MSYDIHKTIVTNKIDNKVTEIKNYTLLAMDTTNANKVLPAAAPTDVPAGVLKCGIAPNAIITEHAVEVVVEKYTRVIYGASVTRGDKLTSDANGFAITATGTDEVWGVAESTGVVNEVGTIRLTI